MRRRWAGGAQACCAMRVSGKGKMQASILFFEGTIVLFHSAGFVSHTVKYISHTVVFVSHSVKQRIHGHVEANFPMRLGVFSLLNEDFSVLLLYLYLAAFGVQVERSHFVGTVVHHHQGVFFGKAFHLEFDGTVA